MQEYNNGVERQVELCTSNEFCHFPVEECAQGLLLCVCLCCVNSRWSTWVVRVGAPRKIFKPHSQISRLGMWTICFHYIPKDYLLDYFSRKFYDDVVNCIFLR